MIAPNKDNDPGGRGDAAPVSPVQHNKIVSMMLNPRRRWKLSKEAKQAAMAATLDNLADEDGRVRNAAVANLIRMEGQNQGDQHKMLDKLAPNSSEASVTNQQINIYLPANGRETANGHTANGRNGKH